MNATDLLIAQNAILKTTFQLCNSEDELDRSAMLACFIPDEKISLDMCSHLDMPPTEILPEEWWEQVHSVLGGFTATQHITGNNIVTFDEDDTTKAYVKQSVIAYHGIESDGKLESVTARAIQEFEMRFWEGRWLIRKLVIKRSVPLDNAGLYQKAMERAKTDALRKPKGSA